MSLAPEDWKTFMNVSGQFLFGAAEGEEDEDGNAVEHIANCEEGDWVAMCERNDQHLVVSVLVVAKRLADKLDENGRIWCDEHLNIEHGDIKSRSGVMFMTDRKVGRRLFGFVPPDEKLNERIVRELGKPNKKGKSEQDSFVETCFHLARDAQTELPQVESIPFACMFDIGGNAEYSVYMTDRRDAVGFQIDRSK